MCANFLEQMREHAEAKSAALLARARKEWQTERSTFVVHIEKLELEIESCVRIRSPSLPLSLSPSLAFS